MGFKKLFKPAAFVTYTAHVNYNVIHHNAAFFDILLIGLITPEINRERTLFHKLIMQRPTKTLRPLKGQNITN